MSVSIRVLLKKSAGKCGLCTAYRELAFWDADLAGRICEDCEPVLEGAEIALVAAFAFFKQNNFLYIGFAFFHTPGIRVEPALVNSPTVINNTRTNADSPISLSLAVIQTSLWPSCRAEMTRGLPGHYSHESLGIFERRPLTGSHRAINSDATKRKEGNSEQRRLTRRSRN